MKTVTVFTISFYQAFLSPLLKQVIGVKRMCKQTPTCSAYALFAFQTQPFFVATRKTVLRVLTCR